MENQHCVPEHYLPKKNRYDKDLLQRLNEEYRTKPIIKHFTEYTSNYQIAQAEGRLKNLEKKCDLRGKKVLEIANMHITSIKTKKL